MMKRIKDIRKSIIKRNSIQIILIIVLILEIGVITLNSTQTKESKTEIIKGSLAYDMSTPSKAIGAVDNVFTAKIGRILETKYDANEMPITIYEIEVLENIKGKLPTNIKIQLHQMGGIRKDNKNYVFFENTNLLEKDEEYLILAFVPFEEGNLVINNKYTYIKLSNNSQTKNVTNNIIDDYKEAYKKEEIPSDKMNSFKSKYEIT